MISAVEYTRELGQALRVHLANDPTGLYSGREGALRLAREYGYGLADYSDKEAFDALGRSYGLICVIGYDLKPPVDAKEWVREVREAMNKRKEARHETCEKAPAY